MTNKKFESIELAQLALENKRYAVEQHLAEADRAADWGEFGEQRRQLSLAKRASDKADSIAKELAELIEREAS